MNSCTTTRIVPSSVSAFILLDGASLVNSSRRTLQSVKRELVDLSDQVWQRIRTRLEGLSDAEYFWEPAPGCWTIRQRADGTWMADWPLLRPEPEPFTTIAW